MPAKSLTNKLRTTLIGGRGHTPGMGQTLATGTTGAGANIAFSAATDEDWDDRSLLGKLGRGLVAGGLGFSGATIGSDRFGLLGAAGGTALGMGTNLAGDKVMELAKNTENPWVSGGTSALTNAALLSLGGTAVTTSMLRGGGLRRLAAMGAKKGLNKYLNKPNWHSLRNYIDDEAAGRDMYSIIKDSPELTRIVRNAEAQGKSPLEEMARAAYSSRTSETDARLAQRFIDNQIGSGLFDNLVGNPGTTLMGIPGMVRLTLNEHKFKPLLKKLREIRTADSSFMRSKLDEAHDILKKQGVSPEDAKRALLELEEHLSKSIRPPEELAKLEADAISAWTAKQRQAGVPEKEISRLLNTAKRHADIDQSGDISQLLGLAADQLPGGSVGRRLLDYYLGSPATRKLVSKHHNIQNIPAKDHLLAQLYEDMLMGTASGAVLGAPFIPLSVLQHKKELEEKRKQENQVLPHYINQPKSRLRQILGMN